MTGYGRLPTPSTHGSWSKLNGRFTPDTCHLKGKPQTSILSPGKAGIRRLWRDNAFTQYLYPYPSGFSLPGSPFPGVFGLKNGLLEIPLICGFGKILPVVCLAYGTAQPHTPQSALYPPLWKRLPEFRLKWAGRKWQFLVPAIEPKGVVYPVSSRAQPAFNRSESAHQPFQLSTS